MTCCIWEIIPPSYNNGDYFRSHGIKIPINQPGFNGMSATGFVAGALLGTSTKNGSIDIRKKVSKFSLLDSVVFIPTLGKITMFLCLFSNFDVIVRFEPWDSSQLNHDLGDVVCSFSKHRTSKSKC